MNVINSNHYSTFGEFKYFTSLFIALNNYEGNSLYFSSINNTFVLFLYHYLISGDEQKTIEYHNTVMRKKPFKTHPFLSVFTKLLLGKKISKATTEKTLEQLENHKKYPLYNLLKTSLEAALHTFVLPVTFLNLLNENDIFASILYLSLPSKMQLASLAKKDVLERLSLKGVTWATVQIGMKHLEDEKLAEANLAFKTAALQSNENIELLTSKYYYLYLTKHTINTPFAALLAQYVINNGYDYLFPALLAFYEEGPYQNENLYFYYLVLAAEKGHEVAIKKLLTYYNDETMTNFLNAKLND